MKNLQQQGIQCTSNLNVSWDSKIHITGMHDSGIIRPLHNRFIFHICLEQLIMNLSLRLSQLKYKF